ncbi:SIR2 family NAD-dependent protein deacylase [Chitinophaga sp. NPDC101104]|uniref:SIR2 family NAD-dependent protein deacylase n=1 Tax=Chitinophaga sp. NPDC101104 TaxID=3390561 RepID=UPI003CFCD70C
MKPKLVVLSGAGISAESGLRTFRDSDGLWEGHDVYEVASPTGWQNNPSLVQEFYNLRRKDVLAAMPNAAHSGLAQLEQWYDVRVITQNIDDLHERGGSTRVLHLHGEILKMRSVHDETTLYEIREDIQMGQLAPDGGQFRPHVVWFGEDVSMIQPAVLEIVQADVFVLIGTSLNVYPAAGLVNYLRADVPRYIIDKKIPPVSDSHSWTLIEKPATEGVAELLDLLRP